MKIKFRYNTAEIWVEGSPPQIKEIIHVQYKGQDQIYRVKSVSRHLKWYTENFYSEYYFEVELEYVK
jgi:hypothetical protein